MIKAGKLRPIAVLAEQRLADYPDVPTLAEAGFPGVGTLHWQSMLAPAGTPKEVLDDAAQGDPRGREGARNCRRRSPSSSSASSRTTRSTRRRPG